MSDNPTDRTQATGDAGSTSAATGAATQTATTSADDRRFTQADLDRIVSDRIAREKDAEKERTKKAQEAAREQERIKAGELQAVAEERAAKLADLEPKVATLTETLTARDDLIEQLIKPRVKALPEEFQALLPDGDIAARVTALLKVEKAAEKAQALRSPGTPSGPRGSGAQSSVSNGGGFDAILAEKRSRIGGL
jgi:DNA-binding transcriptional MerR regulator